MQGPAGAVSDIHIDHSPARTPDNSLPHSIGSDLGAGPRQAAPRNQNQSASEQHPPQQTRKSKNTPDHELQDDKTSTYIGCLLVARAPTPRQTHRLRPNHRLVKPLQGLLCTCSEIITPHSRWVNGPVEREHAQISARTIFRSAVQNCSSA